MSEVSNWLSGLGKAYESCAKILSENGIKDFSTLELLEVDEMVNELGFKKIHAKVIYHRSRKDFSKEQPKAELTAPWATPAIPRDEEKIDLSKINLFQEELKNIFLQNVEFFNELIKLAESSSILTEALHLLHTQEDYISKLQIKPRKIQYWGFLSHVQIHSADLCRSLQYAITAKNKKATVWFDMNAERLDARGMADGISSSRWFVLVATKDSFSRPWPIYELLIAQVLDKPILVVVETDERRGGLTLNAFSETIPKPWKFLYDHEWIEIKRRGNFWLATVKELYTRLKRKPHKRQKSKNKQVRQVMNEADEKEKNLNEKEVRVRYRQLNQMESTYRFKLVVLGDTCSGKSSLVHRFVRAQFNDYTLATIGASFSTQTVKLDKSTVVFQIWDTAGKERYHSLAPMYYGGAAAVLMVFDITSLSSFNMARAWVKEIQAKGCKDAIIALAGNKVDRENEREVAREKAMKYANAKGIFYMETSAKKNQNVTELFTDIARKLAKEQVPTKGDSRLMI